MTKKGDGKVRAGVNILPSHPRRVRRRRKERKKIKGKKESKKRGWEGRGGCEYSASSPLPSQSQKSEEPFPHHFPKSLSELSKNLKSCESHEWHRYDKITIIFVRKSWIFFINLQRKSRGKKSLLLGDTFLFLEKMEFEEMKDKRYWDSI